MCIVNLSVRDAEEAEQQTLQDKEAALIRQKSCVKVKDFFNSCAEYSEMFYKIKVTIKNDKKKPIGVNSADSPDEVRMKPGRWWSKAEMENPFGKQDEERLNYYAFFPKHIPDLYCIDFDGALKELHPESTTHDDDYTVALKLFQEWGGDLPYTETRHGRHYYVKIQGMPAYNGHADVFKEFQGDIMGANWKDGKAGKNSGCCVWERDNAVVNQCQDIQHLPVWQ